MKLLLIIINSNRKHVKETFSEILGKYGEIITDIDISVAIKRANKQSAKYFLNGCQIFIFLSI